MDTGLIITASLGLLVVAGLAVSVLHLPAGRTRRAVVGATAGYAVWMAGCVGLEAGLADGWFWGAVRPAALICIIGALSLTPGVERFGAEWGRIMLDGLMTAGSAAGAFWLLAENQTRWPVAAELTWSMLWLVPQLLIVVSTCGLASRVTPGHRLSAGLVTSAGLAALAGDTLGLVTGDARLGLPFWLAGGLVVAAGNAVYGSDFFDSSDPDDARPRSFRVWQLPVPLAVTYLVFDTAGDWVAILLAGITALAVCAQLVLHTRRNERLWDDLEHRTRRYDRVLRDTHDVIIQVGPTGDVEYVNDAARTVLGTDPERMVGLPLFTWLNPDDVERDRSRLDELRQSDVFLSIGRWAAGDGTWREIEWSVAHQPEAENWVLTGRDVSERTRLEAELVAAARTDPLSALLNRSAFLAALDERLQDGAPTSVAVVNLDRFKLVNETEGYGSGDRMLRRAGEWLGQAVEPGAVLARLGGDEFAVLLPAVEPPVVLEQADMLLRAFAGFDPEPVGRSGVTVSVGVVIGAVSGAVDVLRDADLAVYRAKQQGGSAVVRYESWMSERVVERSRLRADLESAIRDERLEIHLQPVVELQGGRWTGFEALVRWPHGDQTWSPAQFLPVANESGLIVPLGTWVLNEALRQLAGWHPGAPSAGPAVGVAVNVSAQQLARPDFGTVVREALIASGVDPARLTLEITEQAAIQDLGRTASRLDDLRRDGVRIAIDDFGTGFSSLQYLARLPVDVLKIDRKFVWGLGKQKENDVLVRSMITLASDLGLEIVAEGVETQGQADLLVEYGARLAQGYLFSKPRPVEELRTADPFVSPAPPLLVPGRRAR